MTRTLLVVALGGALGSALRAGLIVMAPAPWTVLGINVAGSLAIGVLAGVLAPGDLGLLLMTGVLGGFTTFSAFSLDALRLLEAGRAGSALLYVGGSVGLALLACWVGLRLGRGLA